jgi:hypothetical protein
LSIATTCLFAGLPRLLLLSRLLRLLLLLLLLPRWHGQSVNSCS